MAPHSGTLAWKIPWMEEPGRLQSTGATELDMTEHIHTCKFRYKTVLAILGPLHFHTHFINLSLSTKKHAREYSFQCLEVFTPFPSEINSPRQPVQQASTSWAPPHHWPFPQWPLTTLFQSLHSLEKSPLSPLSKPDTGSSRLTSFAFPSRHWVVSNVFGLCAYLFTWK